MYTSWMLDVIDEVRVQPANISALKRVFIEIPLSHHKTYFDLYEPILYQLYQ